MKTMMTIAFVGALMTLGAAQAGAMTPSGISTLNATAEHGSAVEKTGWHRRCWWRHGHRFCRRWR